MAVDLECRVRLRYGLRWTDRLHRGQCYAGWDELGRQKA